MSAHFIDRIRFVEKISGPGIWRAGLWLFGYATMPVALVAALFLTVFPAGLQRDVEPFTWLVVSPVIETLMLGAILIHLLKRQKEHHAIMLAALVLGAFHSLNSMLWGFIALPLFLVHGYAFTRLFEVDRQRAFVVPMVAHALHNVLVLLLLKVA